MLAFQLSLALPDVGKIIDEVFANNLSRPSQYLSTTPKNVVVGIEGLKGGVLLIREAHIPPERGGAATVEGPILVCHGGSHPSGEGRGSYRAH
jgi:hypothetical protein